MRYVFQLFIFLISFIFWNCNSQTSSEYNKLKPYENYPRWLKSDGINPLQTSGITYLRQESNDKKLFLIADDIGKIHRLTIKSDTIFTIDSIIFSEKASAVFNGFPKLDFEEIFYDKHTEDVYLSVEGNGENFLEYSTIFKINFKNDNVFENEIIGFEKIKFDPEEELNKYISANIGIEGFTADSNFFYMGLEGQVNNNIFADSTFIYIASKSDKKIIRIISTKELNIHTICGLYSDEDYSLWGIDRNNRKLFHIIFNEQFEVNNFQYWQLKPSIPSYKKFSYSASLESLTVVGDDIYLVDDPWHQFFKPSDEILIQLDQETVLNFNKFVPVIYKYSVIK